MNLAIEGGARILALETSCDETAGALLEGREVLASVVLSQTEIHASYGGVVPELAARSHDEVITRVWQEVLKQAGVSLESCDAIAVTKGPGLPGALMVGVATAGGLSRASGVPLYGIDHLEGHLFAATLVAPVELPAVVLLVSGGHSQIVLVAAPGKYVLAGETVDDAVGEAFDKVARLLGLGYPGGPEIQRAAVTGDPEAINFPRAMRDRGLNLSFSGLKTAVRTYLESHRGASVADVAASFQEAIVDVLVTKVSRTIDAQTKSIVLGGGVGANGPLRTRLSELALKRGLVAVIPPVELCTDNAAMIAAAASFHIARGDVPDPSCDVFPGLRLF